mgnify:CR=1 FL=1
MQAAYNLALRPELPMRLVQKALTFDDVLLVPAYSEVLPRDTSLATRLTRNISLNIPLAVSYTHLTLPTTPYV